MSSIFTTLVGYAQGAYRGATQPCTRATTQPDVLVRVIRSDTQAPIDGLEVDLNGTTLNSGSAGAGCAFFVNPGRGRKPIDINLTLAQQALYRQPARQFVNPGRSGRKTVVIQVDVVPLLTLNFVDHHFAPSQESVRIRYTIRGLSQKTVWVEARSVPSNNARVFRRQLTAGEKVDGDQEIEWDGMATAGALNGHWVHPLVAPLDIRLRCVDAPNGGTGARSTLVLYHSIAIHSGTYTPDGAAPNKLLQPVAWAQYKLNQLGYYCGPVDNVLGAQTRRATRRYTQHAAQFFDVATTVDTVMDQANHLVAFARAAGLMTMQTGDSVTFTGGGNAGNTFNVFVVDHTFNIGDGWGPVAPVNDFGPAINCTFHLKEYDDPQLPAIDLLLTNDTNPRRIIENDTLPAAGETARANIWNDTFYSTMADFNTVLGHVNAERAKLDPFEFPLEASLRLISRGDADGSGDGVVVHAEAIGPVEVEWIVEDPPEDQSVLPPLVPPLDAPSRAHLYIDDGAGNGALPATLEAATQADNCPATNAGRRVAVHDNVPYFHIGNGHAPWTTQQAGTSVYSEVHQNAGANANKLGRAGAWFRGSYIGGDNFIIKARIAFQRYGITHPTLANDHAAFANPVPEARTGTITIWRTHHVAAVVEWPAPDYEIAFANVVRYYGNAHVNLIPETEHIACDTLLNANDRNAYLDLIHHHYIAAGNASTRVNMTFFNDAMYPYAMPAQGVGVNSATYIAAIGNALGLFDDEPLQMKISAFLYSRVRARRTPGSIPLRFKWHRPAFVRSDAWGPFGWLKDHIWWYNHESVKSSIGLCCGLAWVSNLMIVKSKKKSSWVFAHEMAHGRWLRHDEATAPPPPLVSDNPNDHDLADHNCVMSYPWKISSRPNLSWDQGDDEEPRFCGKCVLKLRGWDPTAAALPAQS